ncbi:MAG: hypothetical protein HY289_16030, partial [Planctomycetes bacterium]|nr:hypothetical protein [Planctomycetota bacterium]
GLPYHLLMPTIAVRGDGAVVAGHVTVKLAHVTSLWTWSFPAGKKFAESKPMPRDNDPWGLPAVRRLVYSPDGRFVAGMRKHDLVVWDADTLAELATLTPSGVRDKDHPRAVSALCLAFTPDSQRLAAGCRGGKISFWTTSTWQKGTDVDCSCDFISSLAFSCDGRMIAGAEFSPVVWEPGEY